MTFGEKLRQLRKSRFVTQQKLADALGISQSALSQYEANLRQPDFETIEKFAAYFGVPFSTLMPSSDTVDSEFVYQIADSLHQNPKLGLLFDRTKLLNEEDLDAVLSIVNAIARERGE